MRQRFEQQLSLGIIPISEVYIRTKSRDEMPPLLVALKTIFVTEELNEAVFSILEDKICKDKKVTGRQGMDLWHILVLSVVRHACNTNWDKLHHYANNDMTMRNIMGLHNNEFGEGFYEFEYQNILDNVSLMDAETIDKINTVVVEYGVSLLKKKEGEVLQLKTDSFVIETNVHFPTDLNLLHDSVRKALERVQKLIKKNVVSSTGWRKIKSTKQAFKSLQRSTSWAVFKGKKADYKKNMVKKYLHQAKEIDAKITTLLENYKDKELTKYKNYIVLFINQIDRRLLKGQVIQSEEKVFSIFEEHTEWINKGKRNAELGNAMMITTNQYQLIMDYKIMYKEKDAAQITPLLERLKTKYPNEIIASLSTDKGFYSKDNFECCVTAGIKKTIMPKKGKCNKEEYEREHDVTFVKLRNKHSAVESNINMLEHHGLNRCMDKGKPHFERYVSLSVLAYNLHIIGNELVKRIKAKQEKEKLNCFKQAA
jgi:hypothetical protein